MRLAWFLAVLASCQICGGYKILMDFHFPGKSHSILSEALADALVEAGHEVTLITAIIRKNIPKNLRQIDVSQNIDLIPVKMLNITAILNKETSSVNFRAILETMHNINIATLSNENVIKLLSDPSEEFDLVVVEWMMSDSFVGLSQVYNCPYIWFSTVEPNWLMMRLLDEPLNPSYNPDLMSSNVPPFTFIQRVTELGIQVVFQVLSYVYAAYEYNIYDSFGPHVARKGRVMAPLDLVKYNGSLMLGNSHVSLGQATRLPQSYKPVGGFHINSKVKPLPEDLQKLLDDSENGLIYFSLGSNLKSKEMPDHLKKSLLKVFGALKYNVLWKFEENFPEQPRNVHVINWAPQQSILAHPNCVLFITHGGLLSTTETVHFGVPIIGIPVFADQFVNVDKAVKKGFAKRVDLANDMAEHLRIAIDDILTNSSYREKAKELSLVYHDRVAPPRKEAVHWVEHVVRTHGAPHLRSPALLLPWYQKLYLDLIALVIVTFIALKIIFKILFCGKNKSKANSDKTKLKEKKIK